MQGRIQESEVKVAPISLKSHVPLMTHVYALQGSSLGNL